MAPIGLQRLGAIGVIGGSVGQGRKHVLARDDGGELAMQLRQGEVVRELRRDGGPIPQLLVERRAAGADDEGLVAEIAGHACRACHAEIGLDAHQDDGAGFRGLESRIEVGPDESRVDVLRDDGLACLGRRLRLEHVAGETGPEHRLGLRGVVPDMPDWAPRLSPRGLERRDDGFCLGVVAVGELVEALLQVDGDQDRVLGQVELVGGPGGERRLAHARGGPKACIKSSSGSSREQDPMAKGGRRSRAFWSTWKERQAMPSLSEKAWTSSSARQAWISWVKLGPLAWRMRNAASKPRNPCGNPGRGTGWCRPCVALNGMWASAAAVNAMAKVVRSSA